VDPEATTKVLYLSTVYGKGTPPPREFGVEQVKEKMGILPSQIVDYKALCGDSSDNIPGVKGIGDKTAVQLLTTYGSLEKVYESLDQIKGAVRQKLEAGKDDARHSQWMAQIHLDVPLEVDWESCRLRDFDETAVNELLEKLEFRTFLNRIQKVHRQFSDTQGEESSDDSVPAEQKTTPTPQYREDGDLWFFSAEDTATAQKVLPVAITPHIIDTPKKLTELIDRLKTFTTIETPVAWDTETTALEPRDADLVGIGCCWGAELSDMAYIPLGHTNGGNLDKAATLDALRPILESVDYPKALQNAKFDRLVLRCQGIKLAGVVFDPMLASYVLNPDESLNLTELSGKHLNITAQSYTDLVPKGKTIADLEISAVADYCGLDAYTTFLLVPKLRALLEEVPALHRLLLDVEQPLEPVLAQMEYCGVRIDVAYLKELSQKLETDLAAIELHAYEVAGQQFNLGSPKQLSDLLFNTLGLDTKKSRRMKTGFSTDAATLEKLQGDHPVIDAILEQRTLSKLKSTYVDALPLLVRPDTHRVHTNFNQTGTTTGRLSSSNPNLQNIPIRTAFSRQIRKAFISEPGWVMVAADYS
ncbi:MAG TPA: DNA polymerase, partial [Crinalium sp.]